MRRFSLQKIPNFHLLKKVILKDAKKSFGLVMLELLWENPDFP